VFHGLLTGFQKLKIVWHIFCGTSGALYKLGKINPIFEQVFGLDNHITSSEGTVSSGRLIFI